MLASLYRWLQRKRYQYEVTFSLYMLSPTEKFIFNSFLFLFLSMIIIAVSLYLPEHISFIARRAWFYWAGEEEDGGAAGGNMHGVLGTGAGAGVQRDIMGVVSGPGAEGRMGMGL
ncbi:hypothetical protein MMC25_001206 [Agyrium rufum]|nr:hypothetical protein [Agyrium rufum]